MSTRSDSPGHLLVPIDLEALVVGRPVAKPGQGWSDLSPDFSRLWEGELLGGQLSPSLETATQPLHPAGVHLHWALPDALTHGRQVRGRDGAEPTAPPEFPYVPNRWLVQRLSRADPDATVRVRAWVIESDYLFGRDEEPQPRCVTLPRLDAPPLYVHAGRHFDHGGWREEESAYRLPLTALGYGDPAFAAYYPACKSLLGFHDPLDDLADGTGLSYLVAGWYSDPARDPLHPGPEPFTPSAWLARLEELKWATEPPYPVARVEAQERRLVITGHGDLGGAFPAGSRIQLLDGAGRAAGHTVTAARYQAPDFLLQVDGETGARAGDRVLPPHMDCPERTLCHGFVCGIDWRGRDAVYASRVPELDAENCRVAVGMSSAEALAALLADGSREAGAQGLLTAFQSDIPAHERDPRELRALLHQHRFSASDGGRRVAIRRASDADPRAGEGEDANLSAEVLGLLDDLNRALVQQEQGQRTLADYRWALFAAWYRLTRIRLDRMGGRPVENADRQIEALNGQIADLEGLIAGAERALDDPAARADAGRRPLDQALAAKFTAQHGLDTPARPFWQPRDPAVLVAARATRWSRRHGHDGRFSSDDRLQCRFGGQACSALRVDIPHNRDEVAVAADQAFAIRRDAAGSGPVPPEALAGLLRECLLLDPAGAERLADQAYLAAGLSTRPGRDRVLAAIRAVQTLEGTASGARGDGTLPSPIARRVWDANPWLPLFLKWRLVWHSSFDALPQALAGWTLDREAGDYRFTDAAPHTDRETLYQGYNLLTPHALDRFREALASCNARARERTLERMLTRLGGLEVLSQVLGGLGEAFRMRDTVLQLPPIRLPPEPGNVIDPIAERVRDIPAASPDPDKPFFPIRAGHAGLLDLAIVDAFGQTLAIPRECLQRPLRADGLGVPGESCAGLLAFPPRVAQPLRLRCDWTPADNPPGSPLNSPVCGWVVPNYLDKGLLVYDAAGNPLGAVQKILRLSAAAATGGAARDGLRGFFWVPPPGTELQPDTIHNPQLGGLVRHLLAMDADTGDAFWRRLEEALGGMDSGIPDEDPLTGILLGRPLVLARLDLGLELAGLPAHDPSRAGRLESGGFERVPFPLLLGDAAREDDGLVGYFRDADATAENPGPLYPAAGYPGPAVADSLAADSPLAVDCSGGPTLTLLMDPLARVRVLTGLLPATHCELPHRWRSAARTLRTAFFQAAPVLGPGGDLRLPKPSDDFGRWSWACRPRVTVWKEYATIDPVGDRAGFPPVRQGLQEGWLKLRLNPVAILQFAVREGGPEVAAGANVTLQWLLKGGVRLRLFSGPDGQRPGELLGDWGVPFPEQFRVRVDADTRFSLQLADTDGNRDERQLTIQVDEGEG